MTESQPMLTCGQVDSPEGGAAVSAQQALSPWVGVFG
eukprot:CAMPEP_0184292642 /NCGR_PEP_ID=MMETSP1049-20130417/4373_1 /TAXON_ID=77928 /ORGANISM="Proteomonas sulcata, Strain CCMP704" /LENGTH=36 /DNA_ID= /DNA_START= /DNA_END= /DNA_ORIENTATION=